MNSKLIDNNDYRSPKFRLAEEQGFYQQGSEDITKYNKFNNKKIYNKNKKNLKFNKSKSYNKFNKFNRRWMKSNYLK